MSAFGALVEDFFKTLMGYADFLTLIHGMDEQF
jgi:hypothetical protein